MIIFTKIKRKIEKILRGINPDITYWQDAKRYYFERTGKKLDYRHPLDLNEKLMWLTRYWRHPLVVQCADKYRVREYVESCGLGDILIPLLGVWNDVSEINFDKLPNQFVLKCNHGSGYNIFCFDKKTLEEDRVKQQLSKWMSEDYSLAFYERHYRNIPRKIVCEELISENAPIEYQFWCVNGSPDSILVCRKNSDHTYDSASYSLGWNHLYERVNEDEHSKFSKPSKLIDMVSYSRILSKPFPFVRVDFYEIDGRVYLAELTFTPCGNILSYYKKEFIERCGNNMTLPSKI